ncbi:MAG TPA: molybdenum cofactor guanylyltransferase [Dehalococcoidia bacterium]|nr:molybdenum cofactor guanylyltransferase [Dehalococcoidia bacterium]
MTEAVAALVLAGGQGRRLGQDKALLELWPGVPLLARVVQVVGRLCPEVLVVVDLLDRYAHLDLPVRWAVDALPGHGPLAALVGGLEAASSAYALVVACDLPFLSLPLLAHMLGLPRDYDALVPRWHRRWQPLHAVYARSCLPVARGLLDEGERGLQPLLSRVHVRPLPPRQVRAFDPAGLSFFDIDTPGRLRRARELAAREVP